MMKPRSVITVACWLLALVFGFAAYGKLSDPASFAEAIHRYRLLPWGVTAAVALYLPWLEVVLALSLLVSKTRAAALALATLLFVVFSVAILSALLRGLDITCGCFGSAAADGPLWLGLLRGIALALGSAWLLRAFYSD